jgi:hypothetical protein
MAQGRPVVLVELPKDHADLVIGEVFSAENLHIFVGIAVLPAVCCALPSIKS